MLDQFSRLNLELLCLMTFDKRLNSFSDSERQPDSRSSKLIRASDDSNNTILSLDLGFPLWRCFETDTYRKLRKSQEYLEKFSIEMVQEKVKNPGDHDSLLDQYLKNPNLDVKDLYGMAADALLAGIDTSSYSLSFALYYISNDRRIQDLMFQEALSVLPSETASITPSIINSEIPYIRAVLKETFRLNPISVGIGRISNREMILGGYHVPKNVRSSNSYLFLSNDFVFRRLLLRTTWHRAAWKSISKIHWNSFLNVGWRITAKKKLMSVHISFFRLDTVCDRVLHVDLLSRICWLLCYA